jgi:hypothetical protein
LRKGTRRYEKNKSRSTEKGEGRRMVNIYGEKENIDKEYGREGIR